ncbi:hypothetical protein V500_09750 [Pseudogymnoascus sp. VKM F-4518 (FW-2643)]|nr:hypothetical protein V500_09750 [Pseudogymnoascus sp. VKM F-4518 (FW-2643)]
MAGKPDPMSANGSAEKDREDGRSTDSESEEDRQNETENKPQGANKVTNVQPMDRKPKFDFASLKSNSLLMNKLPGFLAEMDAANRELEAEKEAGTIAERRLEISDDEGEGEGKKAGQYIEMNLGLGVLEEKTSDSETSSEGESSDDEDVMDKLMGAEKDSKDESEKKKVGIEEV